MSNYNIIKKVITFVPSKVMLIPNKLISINKNRDKIISLPQSTSQTFTYITKITGATNGAAGVAKGSIDFAEAIACKDGICATVSAIGIAADSLSIYTSFIPGPNMTTVVTTPISVGCKVFVWCCKKSKLPWGGC